MPVGFSHELEKITVATTITLTGRLADVTDRSIEAITRVTAKAPAYRPGPDVDIITTQPAQVNLSGDGKITLNVVAGLGWLFLEGDGWSDSIRFVAAEGMTTLWEAVVNALPNAHQFQEFLAKMQSAGMAIEEAKKQALIELRKDAIDRSLLWERGTAKGQNIDAWSSGDGKQGLWSLRDNASVKLAANAGYTPPDGITPHYLEHFDFHDESGSGAYQVAHLVSSSRPPLMMVRSKPLGGEFTPWRTLAFGRQAIDNKGPWNSARHTVPDLWNTPDDEGVWAFPNTAVMGAAVDAGYVPPWGNSSHALIHLDTASEDTATQMAITAGNRGRVMVRQRGWKQPFGPWFDASGPVEALERTRMVAAGSSFVQGGSHGKLWDEDDTWVKQLSSHLGVPIKNIGKGGACIDEITLRMGRRRTWVRVPAGEIPASGSTTVELSWTIEPGKPRWIAMDGTVNGHAVAVNQNGTTGKWTISRAADGPAIDVDGWVEFLSEVEQNDSMVPLVLNAGKNDINAGVSGDEGSVVAHVLAGTQQIVDSLPARAQRLVLIGHFPNLNYSDRLVAEVLAVNEGLRSLYPRAYLDVLGFMCDLGPDGALAKMGLTPNDEDRANVARNVPPAQLFVEGDGGHPRKEFHTVFAQRVAQRIRNRGIVL